MCRVPQLPTPQDADAAGAKAGPIAGAPVLTVAVPLTEDGIRAAVRISVVSKSFLSSMLASGLHARSLLLDLAACQQIAPLDANNVSSYFASCGSPGVVGAVILPLIRFGASVMPKLVEIRALCDKLT